MKEGYKEAKTYKGFEKWFHELQMSFKMYLYTFFIVLLIHLMIPAVYMILFQSELLGTVIQVFLGFHVELWPKALLALFKKGFWIFILATPIWLLYPMFLTKFKLKAKAIVKDEHMRGQRIVEPVELISLIRKDHTKDVANFNIGRIPIPRMYETTHFFIVGKSGSGKTTLLNQVIEKIREKNHKAIIYDTKGDYISKFYNPDRDLIFNPLDVRTLHWNIFDELELVSDIESFAYSLIPPVPQGHEDEYFITGAREVFYSIIYYLYATGQKTMSALWQTVSQGEAGVIETLKQAVHHYKLDDCKRGLGLLEGYEKGVKSASDIISTMKKYSNCFKYVEHHQSSFKIHDWLTREDSGFLFLVNYEKIKNVLKPLASMLIEQLGNAALTLPDDRERRIFFVLDEFASLQRMPKFVDFLERGRSKGISLWIATQDINQIEKEYGNKTMNTIVNNCTTTVAFAVQDVNTCEYLSKFFGDREILETDESLSMGPADYRDGLSLTRRRKTDRLILPSEFALLPVFSFYLKIGEYPITRDKITFKSYPDTQQAFIPDRDRFRIATVSEQSESEQVIK